MYNTCFHTHFPFLGADCHVGYFVFSTQLWLSLSTFFTFVYPNSTNIGYWNHILSITWQSCLIRANNKSMKKGITSFVQIMHFYTYYFHTFTLQVAPRDGSCAAFLPSCIQIWNWQLDQPVRCSHCFNCVSSVYYTGSSSFYHFTPFIDLLFKHCFHMHCTRKRRSWILRLHRPCLALTLNSASTRRAMLDVRC